MTRRAKTRHARRGCQLCGLNHSDELPPLPIDPRPSAERRRAATEIGTAVTGPNEVANIDIRRRCEPSQCFPCCRDGERRVPAQPVALDYKEAPGACCACLKRRGPWTTAPFGKAAANI
jgi:hypothetical protein